MGGSFIPREFPEAPIVAVGAVIFSGKRVDGWSVLLVRRGQEPLKGEWSLPGGVVELGESLEEAVEREVQEETELRVEVVKVVEVLSSIVRERGAVRFHYVIIDFLCRVSGGTLLAGSDVSEVRWVLREELGRYGLTAEAGAVIEKAFRAAALGDL